MSPEFYTGNRQRLMSELEADVFVAAAHDAVQLRGDQSIFSQDAHFLYVTGIDEAGWRVIIEKTPHKTTLIAPHRDETQVLFEGGILAEEAARQCGADQVMTEKEGRAYLATIAKHSKVAAYIGADPYEKYSHAVSNPSRARLEKQLVKQFAQTIDARPALARLRALKQPEEIAQLRRAIVATEEGFRAVEKLLQAGARYEYELEAVLSKAFRHQGTNGHAYEPIVAYGKNACVLHYAKNADALENGGMVLIDAGAQSNNYAADVTRTFAVGEVTDRQKAVHAAVEQAHKKILAYMQPGVQLKDYQDFVDATMQEALRQLGLLKKDGDYRKYFPHAISHGLGLDVHESLGGYKEFVPGMVLTVEPGIYIPEEKIGVRIEDDILITKSGIEVLSGDLPTEMCYTSKYL